MPQHMGQRIRALESANADLLAKQEKVEAKAVKAAEKKAEAEAEPAEAKGK